MSKRARSEESDEAGAAKRQHVDKCAICRGAVDQRCGECDQSGEDRACQGTVGSAVCAHVFHTECIERWLRNRFTCPLCNHTWMFPHGLSLQERSAAKFIDDEEKIVEFVEAEMPDAVYKVLDTAGLKTYDTGKRYPLVKKRLLARTFGQYLDESELKELLSFKKSAKGKK